MDKVIEGQVYSLKFPDMRGRYLRGWYLLVSETGDEYLVQRNISISTKTFQKVYKTDVLMVPYVVDKSVLFEKMKSQDRTFLGVILGIFVSRILIEFIPSWLVFGRLNIPFNIWVALFNVSITIVSVLIFFYCIGIVRKQVLLRFIRKHNGNLRQVGKIRNTTYLTKTHLGKEIW